MPRPSGTRQSPARARSSARAPLMRRPASTMLPDVAGCSAGQHREQGRLAGAVGSEDGDDRAGGHLEVDAVEHLDGPVGGPDAPGGQRGAVTGAAPEVGGQHGFVLLHRGRRAAGQDPAEVEHVDVRRRRP